LAISEAQNIGGDRDLIGSCLIEMLASHALCRLYEVIFTTKTIKKCENTDQHG
jgi:hypothetical protein